MNQKDIIEFLTELKGIRPEAQIVNGWVSTQCPLAPFTHEKSFDRHPSFGVSMHDGRPSIFNCFTCHKKGTLSYLAKLMGQFTGDDFTHLIEEAEITEILGTNLPEWGERKPPQEKLSPPIGQEYWDIYDPADNHPYLEEREIDNQTAQELRLKVDPDDRNVERILFPVCQPDGGLQGFTGRAITEEAHPKVRDYFGLQKMQCLLGAQDINDEHDKIVLVEGLFAFARLRQYEVPVVASLGAHLHPAQAKILKKWRRPVIVLYDNDSAGRLGMREAKEHLGKHISLLKAKWPSNIDDPDDLTERQLRRMLDTLRLL